MRPDILLIAFKATTNATLEEQVKRGQQLLKGTNADFVLANDTGLRRNLILDMQGQVIYDTIDREKALMTLVEKTCEAAQKKQPLKTINKRHKPNV